MRDNKKWNWEESSYEKFKKLTAREVLEWMEEAKDFFKKVFRADEILRKREIKTNVKNI